MIRAPRLIWNTLLSFALNLTLRSAGTLTFIAIVRLGNVRDAGTFSLALGYLAILTTIFVGLDDILVRESTRTPDQTRTILATHGAIRFVLSIVFWLVLVVMFSLISLYGPNDLTVLAILTSSILIDNFGATGQSILNAQGRFGWPLVAAVAGSVIRLAGATFALLEHQSLMVLSLAWPLGSAFTAAIMISALASNMRGVGNSTVFHFDRDLAHYLLRLFPSFSAASILAGLEYQIDLILLSVMLSNEAVAVYSAAVTMMLVAHMVSQAFRLVLYPAMVRSLNGWPTASRQLVGRSLVLMASLSLVAGTGVTLVAPELMNLIYGARLLAAVPILQVLIWNVVFMFLNVPLVRFMLAADGQTAIWRTLAFSLSVNVAANLMLIPSLGVIGAAYARLWSSGLFCILIGWQVFRRLKIVSPQPL